jgi:hypothetical protein
MTREEFAVAVNARMQALCEEKREHYRMKNGVELPAAARSIRLEIDTAIIEFARKWDPNT